MSAKETQIISTTLAGTQAILFFLLLIFGIWRTVVSSRSTNTLITIFYALTCVYLVSEISIQVYQIIMIILQNSPVQNANMVLALNIFCIILDQHILIILTLLWSQMEGSFAGVIGFFNQQEFRFPKRLVPTILWLIVYSAYFIYLVAQGYVSSSNEDINKNGNSINQLLLYVVAQSISGFLLLFCVVWQGHRWWKMRKMIFSFEQIATYSMKKTRISVIFLGTGVFNFFRAIFIVYIIIVAEAKKYETLIISLNAFTFTALIPIVMYIFGFKMDENNNEELLKRKSESSHKNSSGHETELSARSNR